ncbi:hypothetical protein P153DRAFT_369887 [Dothidotthia symphoricarpi CBS 119687]|uniref:Uncharacterized protein n=1 Tax=Dothidotthia symphoricarpi CBS 119687 TaxID=1392245 RepID=A0A6A6A544_9PLEO|nr:uncharacterized protein P153DRAFT_369887 [Dothidotthia symphoricarpi CBS 119687]KAF2125888.1 hypothetical protein P153DRAFT_369887 [Dothidotthia symphoricarpi CBS 119687]
MAELIGGRPEESSKEQDDEGWRDGNWWVDREDEAKWSVKGTEVLELGAGNDCTI